MVSRKEVIQFYSHATVVASRIGGIPEVVVPDETGILVDLDLEPGTFVPKDPAGFSRDLTDGNDQMSELTFEVQ
jgi:hypothetical protein